MPELSPIRLVIHDMRNCVGIINMTARMMSRQRDDDIKFAESHELLNEQVRELTKLLHRADELSSEGQ